VCGTGAAADGGVLALLSQWRFECKCNWCSLSDEESAEKDKEREHMAELFMKEMQAMAPTL
jgi:hypothetical protein